MQRFLVFVLTFLLIVSNSLPVMAQAQRHRLDTKSDESGPAPSFRGGERRGYGEGAEDYNMMKRGMPSQQMMPSREGVMGMGLGYQVHVLGEVQRPGTYRIPASGRLASAIKKAGGFAENGSERRIQLRRKGRKTTIVDFFRFKQLGSLDDNPYLLDNDVIYVPLRDSVIQVVGAVRRPGEYELRDEKTLAQAVQLAGSFNAATARDQPIRVVRFGSGEKKVEEVPIDKVDMKKFAILSGDVVVVPNVVTKETEFDYNVAAIPGDQVFYPSYEDRVFVLGGVSIPGAYPFSPYYTVNQYVSLAGGISDRGKEKYRIINIRGESHKASESDRVNPGDTVMIKQRWMTPAGWLGFGLAIASFGLSASATVLAITR